MSSCALLLAVFYVLIDVVGVGVIGLLYWQVEVSKGTPMDLIVSPQYAHLMHGVQCPQKEVSLVITDRHIKKNVP